LSIVAKIDKEYNQYKSSDIRKKDVILNYVKELEGKLPQDQISTHIAKTLKGYADHSYINKVLRPKYKVAYRIDNVAKRHSKTIPTKQEEAIHRIDDIKEYVIEDLQKYDRQLLIDIIKHLDNKLERHLNKFTKSDKQLQRLMKGNKELMNKAQAIDIEKLKEENHANVKPLNAKQLVTCTHCEKQDAIQYETEGGQIFFVHPNGKCHTKVNWVLNDLNRKEKSLQD
jgi:hypothetical protein